MTISKSTLFFLTLLCGFSVANLYYNQTLFVMIGQTFDYPVDKIAILSTITQIAYACGLILFVPLADISCRKKLIIVMLTVNTIMQLICAITPTFMLLMVGSCLIGITSIAAQIIIPGVTLISSDNQKGKHVGMLMSGLFSGIVFARLLSGFVGHYLGWRDVYLMSACIDIILVIGMLSLFPAMPSGTKISYLKLIHSLGHIFTSEPVLQKSSLLGALIFCAFSGVWGALDYLLSSAPYFYTSNIIGLFSLIGLFGIFSSIVVGRTADKYGVNTILMLIPIIVIIGFILIGVSSLHLLFFIAGMILLDTASRASLISNQLMNYSLNTENRSRINTIFMSCYFLGGALGTSLGSLMAVNFGWHGLAIFGVTCALLTAAVYKWWVMH